MAKSKWTDGVLCRDDTKAGKVVFFASPCDVDLWCDGEWCEITGWKPCVTEWTIARWRKCYSLRPPAKGKKFEAEMQL